MIKIPKELHEKIIAHAKRDLPIEACGYIGGVDGVVKEVYEMRNTDQSEEHFSFDPQEQFDVFKKANASGLRLIACYHSHPLTPSRPSKEDIRLAYDPNISYIIVSLADKLAVLKSFKIRDGKVEEEEVEVI